MGDAADMAIENERLGGYPVDTGWGSPDFDYSQGRSPRPRRSNGWNQINTPRKEPAMKGKLKLQQELEQLDSVIPSLEERRDEIKRMLANSFPCPKGNRISINVWYAGSTQRYEYLLLRIPSGQWYSTGTDASTATFRGWQQVQQWLADKRIEAVEIRELAVKEGTDD